MKKAIYTLTNKDAYELGFLMRKEIVEGGFLLLGDFLYKDFFIKTGRPNIVRQYRIETLRTADKGNSWWIKSRVFDSKTAGKPMSSVENEFLCTDECFLPIYTKEQLIKFLEYMEMNINEDNEFENCNDCAFCNSNVSNCKPSEGCI